MLLIALLLAPAGPIGCSSGHRSEARSASAKAKAPRPNVLFIITDDQRWDAMGVVQREMGDAAPFPWFKTPNMDRLAAGGARFRNAFVVHSLCSPSRAAFLTGKYSHENGVKDNATPIPPQATWASALRDAGYQTAYFGKWHCDRQVERPGFDHVVTYIGQGNYENCPLLIDGKQAVADKWVDDAITDYAIRFLEQQHDKPFAAVIGIKAPHAPRKPAPRRANDYADKSIPAPVNADALPPFFSVYSGGKPHKPYDPHSVDRLNYLRAIASVDDDLGRVLDALDRLKLADDTLVCFVGDNGFYLGEHGLGDKRSGYEESLRIPMLIRYPRLIKPGTLVDATALNIDFAPTVLDLAGLKPADDVQGRSLRPLFGGKAPRDWRSSFLYENYQDPTYPKVTFDVLGVRTSSVKLMTYPGHDDWTQLFDLKIDPHEMHNLIDDPAAAELKQRMEKELKRQMEATGFPG